ncbi:MAG: histidine phosphatase family protein [Anaerolineae bacterium]|jgi:phosphohistidine phosphatase|nr:histidine phosphatase family protein [Anaerolineae bacterium]
MKTLLIVRHAKSSWKQDNIPDHDRPLKGRGKRDARELGKHIILQDLVPQHIISSTAKRTRNTAKLVAEACHYQGEILFDRDLYEAGPTGYLGALQRVDDRYQRVMVIGHNPGLEVLLEVLTGEARWLTTAAMACVELPIASWTGIQEYVGGRLASFWSPKESQGAVAGTR